MSIWQFCPSYSPLLLLSSRGVLLLVTICVHRSPTANRSAVRRWCRRTALQHLLRTSSSIFCTCQQSVPPPWASFLLHPSGNRSISRILVHRINAGDPGGLLILANASLKTKQSKDSKLEGNYGASVTLAIEMPPPKGGRQTLRRRLRWWRDEMIIANKASNLDRPSSVTLHRTVCNLVLMGLYNEVNKEMFSFGKVGDVD